MTTGGENRLTEILAVALRDNEEFARAMLERFGLPRDGGRVHVRTQVWISLSDKLDLEIALVDDAGRYLSRLWCELKTGSRFGPNQLERYAVCLRAQVGERTLVAITPPRTEVPTGWDHDNWQWLGGLALSMAAPGWRRDVHGPKALARLRVLHELLTHLEEHHDVSLEPLDADDLIAFSPREAGVRSKIERLFGLIASDDEEWHWTTNKQEHMYIVRNAREWAAGPDCHAEITLSVSDGWDDAPRGEPSFGAGLSLPAAELPKALSAREAFAEEVSISVWGGYVRIWKTRRLSEFMDVSKISLEQQAEEIRRWADQAIEEIESADVEGALRDEAEARSAD